MSLCYFPAPTLASKARSKKELLNNFDYVRLFGVTVSLLDRNMLMVGEEADCATLRSPPPCFSWASSGFHSTARKAPQFPAPFIIGALGAIGLGVCEGHWAKNPLLHPFLFRRIRTFIMLVVTATVGGMLFFSPESFLPTYLALLYDGGDGRQVGIDGIPFGIGTQIGGVGSAILLPIIGPIIETRWMVTFGVALQVIFIPLMCLPGPDTKAMALVSSTFVCMAGYSRRMDWSKWNHWSWKMHGWLGWYRHLLDHFQSKAAEFVPTRVASAAMEAGLPEKSVPELLDISTGALTTVPLTSVPGISATIIEQSSLALKLAYRDAFRYVSYTSIPFGILSLIYAMSTKDVSHIPFEPT
ncbi:hypothetical protein LTR10_023065 [Elasticomyces elasticus]|uniref:Major facilitator superfamily (MFS) profile domain-containing protein n=1 Tax=Exophiala sideris TaxID=1016849 RepID=A0ABR0IUQ9_9EURO|nr:hypothetical protein LTR10_023065 [Elasticomyces elasticus]KAK5021090.1 hypothetical protein LTS07_011243 [Exophiala sideris]KAK5023288.1 hypothetical protein LTR13_011278 [Exophiala sideris]KAK5048803.1 hypothetical protein LTR69_011266 [Exophiala sideris]KAK5176260.1 hypothetical protein LTR44_011191 [Eurotiomycetes sp. CCFEE 6388]